MKNIGAGFGKGLQQKSEKMNFIGGRVQRNSKYKKSIGMAILRIFQRKRKNMNCIGIGIGKSPQQNRKSSNIVGKR